jgi:hypothetical protein
VGQAREPEGEAGYVWWSAEMGSEGGGLSWSTFRIVTREESRLAYSLKSCSWWLEALGVDAWLTEMLSIRYRFFSGRSSQGSSVCSKKKIPIKKQDIPDNDQW